MASIKIGLLSESESIAAKMAGYNPGLAELEAFEDHYLGSHKTKEVVFKEMRGRSADFVYLLL